MGDAKSDMRKAAAARRTEAHAHVDPGPALGALVDEITARQPRMVAGYVAIRSELDPEPALKRLHAAGIALCLPVVLGARRPLGFRLWAPGAEMTAGSFQVPIPLEDTPADPDLLITPLLAFDNRGYRLGYGGGFYDRTLAQRPHANSIGLAYATQKVPRVPTEPTDEPLDTVITERAVHRFRPCPSDGYG